MTEKNALAYLSINSATKFIASRLPPPVVLTRSGILNFQKLFFSNKIKITSNIVRPSCPNPQWSTSFSSSLVKEKNKLYRSTLTSSSRLV
jgi:hypothetical protein